jgi:carboxymethylenebutenolidase
MDILLPPSGAGPGVVVAHAWWGLNQTIRDYGVWLAKQGFVVGLPDLFNGKVATSIEAAQELADTDWSPNAADRLQDAIAELAKNDAVRGDKVALVAFSYSGFHAYGLAGRAELPLSRVVIHYATRRLANRHLPVLVHFAENDPFESTEDIKEVADGLAADGTPNAAYSYAGTTHWFAEADRPEYDEAAAELAKARTLDFLRS